jgi:hypothetical protein
MNPEKVAEMRRQLIEFAVKKPRAVKADLVALVAVTPDAVYAGETHAQTHAVVLPYKKIMKKVQAKAALTPTARPMRARQAVAVAR